MIHVLYVDDDPGIAVRAKGYLERSGEFIVRNAVSGAEALEALEIGAYDAVVSEYQVPGIDSIALLKEIRRSGDGVPFVMFTARGREEIVIRALNEGADSYVQKNGESEVQFAELASRVRAAVHRKRTEERRILDEELFYRVLENIEDIYYRTDRNGDLIFASPGIRSILGYRCAEDLTGMPIAEHIFFVPAIYKALLVSLQETGPVVNREVVLRKKDGSPVTVTTNCHYYYEKNGDIAGIEGIFRDISGVRRTETALRQINRQHSLLTSVIRHDILNQITALKAYLGIAELKVPGDKMKACFRKLNEATDRIQSQIVSTRAYENIGAKEPQWTDPSLIVIQLAVPPEIVMDVDLAGLEIYTDPTIVKVFPNLLDHSVKCGGVTKIRVSSVISETALIIWEDDGAGIPAAEKTLIFERGIGKNQGIGMFLVEEILSITGITIRETGEPGKGTRFEIMVPPGMFRVISPPAK